MRALKRRLRVRRWVKLENIPVGNWPESATPGRWSSTTWSRSHWTPAQLQGLWLVAFQKRVLPPTEERRASNAARSEVRSGFANGRRRRKKRVRLLCIALFCIGSVLSEQSV